MDACMDAGAATESWPDFVEASEAVARATIHDSQVNQSILQQVQGRARIFEQ